MTIGRLIDISIAEHNGLPPGQGPEIDWAAVAGDGVEGVFIKATQGTTYLNPWLEIDLLGARGAGIETICYHYADMGDPLAEARWFIENAGDFARMLDFETNTNVGWARSFLNYLARPPGELITYGSLSTLKDFYAQLPSLAFFAAYDQGFPGMGVCWQFTDSATIAGIPTLVDEDGWYGDESQFETLFAYTAPDAPPIYPGGLMFDGLAASKEDNFNATIRFLWGQIRSDQITAEDFSILWYVYNLPVAQKGYGGSIDLTVAAIIDGADEKGTLRPGWAGAA